MDIHKKLINEDTYLYGYEPIKTWISIHEYLLFTDIHCRISLHGYPCLNINVNIHICTDDCSLTSKNHGYPR